MQPGYLPWLGYFDQMQQVDIFVHATNLQYTRQDWRNRNRIRTRKGWQWLTVPVKSKGRFYSLINEMPINNDVLWATKHFNVIKENYRNAPFYQKYIAIFKESFDREWRFLLELDLHFINLMKGLLGITTECIDLSQLNLGEVDRNTRLIEICRLLGAETYLSASAARSYIIPQLFEEAGIELRFQDYNHPVYPQLHGEFIPYLSSVDLLFNCGEESLSILTKVPGNK